MLVEDPLSQCSILNITEVRQLIFALANKVAGSNTELVAQAVGNALYGCQMMTSDHEEVHHKSCTHELFYQISYSVLE
jgi:hypothetical protein